VCFTNVSPEFNYILINRDGQSLKLLNGESFRFHPRSSIRILDISTNICFNRGVRLAAKGFDVNALLHDDLPISTLLPDQKIFDRYTFRIVVKQYNQVIGDLEIVVEPDVEDWLNKVDRSIGSNRKAVVLERALELVTDDRRINERLIREYISLKRWDQAAAMLEEMAKETPGEKTYNDLLEIYEVMGRSDKVILVLRRLAGLSPDDADLRFRLASVLEEAQKYGEAVKEYEGLLERLSSDETLSVYKSLGFLYTKIGQNDKAITVYLKAVKLDKEDANLYYNLSFLYEKIGRKEKADLYLAKALELKSEDSESRIDLAERLINKGKLKEAERYLADVLKRTPNSMDALLLMVNISERRGDKKGLIKFYRRILTLDPQNKTVIYNLGVIEYETGNPAKALPYFEEFVRSDPNDREARGFLFDIYKRLKKDDLAYKESLTLISLNPKDISYFHYVFEYLNERGRYKDMIDIMEKALKSHPKDTALREYLVLAYLNTGNEKSAIGQIEAIMKSKPNDISLLLQLAELQEKQGMYEKAVMSYSKIMDLSPGHKETEEAYVRVLLHLAGLQEKQGRPAQALDSYKRIIDISPGQEEAEEAYLRLRLEALPRE